MLSRQSMQLKAMQLKATPRTGSKVSSGQKSLNMQPVLGSAVTTLLLAMLCLAALSRAAPAIAVATEQGQLLYPGKSLRDGILSLAEQHESGIRKQPEEVAHYVGLCEAHAMHWCFGFVPRDEVLPQLQAAANKAVALDKTSAGARTVLGIVKLSERDWEAAGKEFAAAVKSDPQRASSRHWQALYLAAMGRHEQAIEQSEIAVALDDSPGMQTGLGAICYFGRDWPRMIKQLSATIDDNPNFAYAYDWLGMAYVQEERFPESIATYQRAVELSEGLAEILAGLGHAYALAGKEAQARTVLEKLLALDQRWYVPPVQIAYVYVGLGEYDLALQMLERANQEHSWELVFLREEPWFDPLRPDPRFRQLEANLQFPARPVQ